ncbi:MAG: zinc-dependent alcohol dehydrogenase family protein [Candidatus Hadarchaeia archaeon]
MKAAVYDGEDFSVREISDPDLDDNEILIRVEACGICGTDIHVVEGDFPSSPPVVLGHEFSGEVEEVGCDVGEVDVGSTVTVNPNLYCGKCSYCREGKPNHCKNWEAIGLHRNGGFEEYVAVPESQVLEFNGLDYNEAAFAEPVSCAVRGIQRLDPELGDSVLVMGGGPIGLILSQLLSISGAGEIILSEPVESKRRLAGELGVDEVIDPTVEDPRESVMELTEDGVDSVVEATGIPEVSKKCLEVVKKEGDVLQFGVNPQDSRISISPFKVYREEISLLGSFTNPFTTQKAVKLIESESIELKPLVTSEVDLKDIEIGMDKFGDKDEIKIMVRP